MLITACKLSGHGAQVQLVNKLFVNVEHHGVVQSWLAHGTSKVILYSPHHRKWPLASSIHRWQYQKQLTHLADLFKKNMLTGGEALEILDNIVDCGWSASRLEVGSKNLQLCGELWGVQVILVNTSDFLDFIRKIIFVSSLQQQSFKVGVCSIPRLIETTSYARHCWIQDLKIDSPVMLLYRAAVVSLGITSLKSSRFSSF